MALVGRIVVIVFALLIASLAASAVLQIGVFLPLWRAALSPDLDQGFFSAIVGVGFFLVSLFAFVPAIIVVALAEAFSLRSVLFYAVAGALGALVLSSGVGIDPTSLNAPPTSITESLAAAGIVAGLVYWLLAGRNAGRWREPPEAPHGPGFS